MNLHVTVPYGTNNHHIAEAIFKADRQGAAAGGEPRPAERDDVPSTKGSLNG